MNTFFKTKKVKKTTTSNSTQDDQDLDNRPPSRTSPSKSSSPTKKSSSPTKSNRRDDNNHKTKPAAPSSARSSRSFTTKPKSESSDHRHTFDPNSHPLNLPPDELRRLSALNMSNPTPMDVDAEVPNGVQPVPMDLDADVQNAKNSASASAEVPQANGVDAEEAVPPPPAHKSGPSSPIQDSLTPEDAEAFKIAGNKYFKAKEYKKAIEEYTKGVPKILPFCFNVLIRYYHSRRNCTNFCDIPQQSCRCLHLTMGLCLRSHRLP